LITSTKISAVFGLSVIARLLSPAGRFVLFEGHPAEWLFDAGPDGRWIATDYDYFGGPEASRGWAPEYIDRLSIADPDLSWKFARAWTLGEVVTAGTDANPYNFVQQGQPRTFILRLNLGY